MNKIISNMFRKVACQVCNYLLKERSLIQLSGFNYTVLNGIKVLPIVLGLFFIFSLTTQGAIKSSTGNGNWNTASTWSPSGVPAAGDVVTISSGNTVTVDVTTATIGSLTVTGTLKVGSSSSYTVNVSGDVSGAGTLSGYSIGGTNRTITLAFGGNWSFSGTITNRVSATINGSVDQTWSKSAALYSLTVNKTGGTLFFQVTPTYSKTLTLTAGNVNYSGNVQDILGGKYPATLTLSGNGAKTFKTGTTSVKDLILTGSATATFVTNISITGNLNIGTGTTLNLATYTANRSAAGGTLTIAGALSLASNTGGQTGSNFPTNFSAMTMTGGTVNYSNNGSQTVYAVSGGYNNLTLSGSGIKTTTGISVNGILSMEGTATASAMPTYGTSATLQYNTSTARNAGVEWPSTFVAIGGVIINNSGAISLNEAKIFNTGVPLNINLSATLNTTSANNYALTFGGNFTKNGNFTANASSITINGTTTNQTIGAFSTNGPVTIAGSATQNIAAFSSGAVSMTKSGGTATFTGNIIGAALTINGAGGTLNLGNSLVHTFSGNITLTAGILDGGTATTLNVNSSTTNAWSGDGTKFTPGTSTVVLGGTNQTMATTSNTFYNLTFSGTTATKTMSNILSVTNILNIISSAKLSLPNSSTSTTKVLQFGGLVQTGGSYGFTGSGATYINTTYFTSTTGVLNASTANRFIITGTAAQVAGSTQNITIKAADAAGSTISSYAGDKSLTFTGANSSPNPVTAPTIKDKTGNAVAFGNATTINFTNGIATVSGVNNGVMALYNAESAYISVTDNTTTSTGSDRLFVTITPATSALVFTTQPGGGLSGSTWITQPVVSWQDTYGNPNTGTTKDVSLAIGTNPSTGNLSGTTTVAINTSTGQATFSDLSIDNAGTGYSLSATAPSVTGVTSNSFNITNPIPTLSSISPSVVCKGGASFTLRVYGTNFNSTSVVNINGSSRTTTFVDGSTLSASILNSDIASSGTPTITVLNPGGGTSTGATLTVTQVTITPSTVQPTCSNGGSISIVAGGGTGTYTYDWSDLPGTNNVQDRSGLSAGSYTVTVSDANGCSDTSETYTLVAASNCTGISVCKSDVASVLSVPPDPNNYGYTWTVPSGAIINSGQGASSISVRWTGVAVGSYEVSVVAYDSCNGTTIPTHIDVYVQEPTALAYADLACTGGNLNLYASGGVSYAWTGPNSFSSQSADPVIYNIGSSQQGTYNVTVTNSAGCSKTASVTVTVNTPPSISAGGSGTTISPSTTGNSEGGIVLGISGGSGFSYQWNAETNAYSATTKDISVLPSDNYTVIVTNSTGCSSNKTFTISNSDGPSATATATNITCNGLTNGFITLTNPSGGTSPYTYEWTGPGTYTSTAQSPTNLGPGTYSVVITDANSFEGVATASVVEPSAIEADGLITNVNCYGGSTGEIVQTVSGGTSTYAYAWTGPNSFVATTKDISGRVAGTYHVTITDHAGVGICNLTKTYIISQPVAAISAIPTITNVSCNAGSNGQVVLAVSGGTAPYTYAWKNAGGSTIATTKDISGLAVGTYTVTITDSKNCVLTLSGGTAIAVNQPSSLLLTKTTTDVGCKNGSNGAINLTVSGGTQNASAPYYTYAWSNGLTSEDLSNLLVGNYSVTVTDANGCTATASATIGEPLTVLTASISSQANVTCKGGANGSATANGAGGTGPYYYSWNTSPVQTNATATGLAAGVYTCSVSDAHGCSVITIATITEPTVISVSGVVTNVLCNGSSTGAIDITASGGTGVFSYDWSDLGTPGVFTDAEDRTHLAANTYTVTARDANNCSSAATSFIITQPSTIALSMSETNLTCFGGSNGKVDLSVSGGVSPYTYDWTGPNTFTAATKNISGLSIGAYSVTVTDANNCTQTSTSATLSQPSAITLSSTQTNVSCWSGSNGAIDLTIAGGTGSYTIAWSNGASTEDLSGLTAGIYSVSVSDANGCSSATSVTITEPASALSASITGQVNVTCKSGTDGSATATGVGGTAPYHYSWDTYVVQSTATATDMAAGFYTVAVTDAKGCTANTNVTITEPTSISVSGVVTNILCNGSSTGAINISATGGTGSYTYDWTDIGTPGVFSDVEDRTGLVAGTYTVTVKDASNCSSTATSFTITQAPALSLSTVSKNISCSAGSDGYINLGVSGGVAPYTFAWTGSSSYTATTQNVSGIPAGSYSVTVTDANGCHASVGPITLTQPGTALSVAATPTAVSCKNGSNGSISAVPSGGTGAATYSWSTGATTSSINSLSAGSYNLVVTDVNGCTASTSATVTEPSTQIELYATAVESSSCGIGTGSIDLTVVNGNSPYTYAWTNTGQTIQDPVGLNANTYTATVTDATGCIATLAVPVGTATALSVSVTTFARNCISVDGEAVAVVTGGVAPYTYLWNTGATTQDLNNLDALTYTVTVTDANGCTANNSGTVGSVSCLPPVAVPDVFNTNYNTLLNGNVGTNDSDPDGSHSGLEFYNRNFPSPTQGTLTWGTNYDGSFNFTPTAGYAGTFTLNYRVDDPTGLSASGTYTITVGPNAVDDPIGTSLNTPVSGNVSTNDVYEAGSSFTKTSDPTKGVVVFNTNGTFTYTPNTGATGDDSFTYSVCLPSPNTGVCSSATVLISIDGKADVEITKTVDHATPNVGDNVVFTLTATNHGPNLAMGVVVSDPLPSGYTYVSNDGGSAATELTGTVTWNIGTLPNLATTTLHITARVNATGSYNNTATITGTNTDPTPGNNSSSRSTTPVPQSDVTIVKTVDHPSANVGSTVVFTLAATNNGPSNATGVSVTDLLPSGFAYVSDNGSGAYVPGTGIWTIGSLANGATATLAINSTVNASGTYVNSSSVSSTTGDPTPGNNSSTATVVPGAISNLKLVKTVSNTSPYVGSTVEFTLTATNNGPSDATSVKVTDALPAGYTYVSDDASGKYVSGTGIWTIGALANGASSTLKISAKVNASGNYTNSAVIGTNDQPDPDVTDNTGSVTPTVTVPQADLAVVKTVDNASPTMGNNVVFTITVTNNGLSDATGVSVTDLLPSGYTYVSNTPSVGSYVSSTGIWTIGSLANAATATLAITATVKSSGTYLNSATVSASTADLTSSNNTSTKTINPNPIVVITNPAAVCFPSTVNINSASVTAGSTSGLAYTYWTDAGATTSYATPLAVTTSGTYYIKGTTAGGGFTIKPVTVTVNALPTPSFSAQAGASGCKGSDVTYTTESGQTSYVWSIPGTLDTDYSITTGGTGSTSNTVTLKWLTSGSKSVTINYTNSNGCAAATATSSTATTVTNCNTPPVITSDGGGATAAINVPENTTAVTTVTATDSDLPAQTLTYSITGGVDAGKLAINSSTGVLTFVNAPNYEAPTDANLDNVYVLEVTVTDDGLGHLTDVQTISVTVTDVNEPPVVSDLSKTGLEDTDIAFVATDFTSKFTDVDGNSLTKVKIVSLPANGTLKLSGVAITAGQEIIAANLANITFTPNADWNGSTSFNWNGFDGTVYAVSNANVNITITPVNDPPVAVNDTKTTNEDTATTINVTTNDTDVDGTIDVATVDLDPSLAGIQTSYTDSHGDQWSVNNSGVVTFTPALNYNGLAVINYTIKDNSGAVSNIGTISITVTPVNDPPVALNDNAGTAVNTPVITNVLANDYDVDGNLSPTTVTVVTAPLHGTTSVNATTGAITYTPATGYYGTDSYVYRVCDTDGACAQATVTIQVPPLAPVAVNDVASTNEDTPVSINVISNDYDPQPNFDYGSVTITSAPSHGTTAINPTTGVVTYTPALNYNGTDQFTYQVCDLTHYCSQANVNITIIPVNDPPVAVNDVATIDEDGVLNGSNLLGNDSDPDFNTLTINTTPVSGPSHGTLVINANGTYTYTPAPNYNGTDSFVYQVCDNGTPSLCATATVNITINAVNDPPVAVNDVATMLEDGILNGTNLLANDSDPEGNALTINTTPVSGPSHGTVVINANGTYTYTPAANYNGTDSFTYKVCDNGVPSECATAIVTITITPVNDPPVAVNDTKTTNEDTPTTINVTINDTDVDGTIDVATVDLDPSTSGIQTSFTDPNGNLWSVNNLGVVTFTPVLNYNGLAVINYTVKDNSGAISNIGTISITVTPVNDPPVALNDNAGTSLNTPVITDVLANDYDVDGNLSPSTVTVVTAPLHGTTSVNPTTGAITYTPATGYFGPDSYVYRVCDTDGSCAQATVSLQIPPLAPVAVNDVASTNEDSPVNIDVVANDYDPQPNLDYTSVTIISGPSHGTTSVNPTTGVVTYTPALNYNGQDQFTYQVCDLTSYCSQALVNITVVSVNDAPVAVNDVGTIDEDGVLNGPNLLGNDSDPDFNTLTINTTPVSGPSHGTLVINANGTYTYTPAPNYNGTDSFVYQVCDNGSPSLCANATVTLTINAVNDPPVAVNDATSTIQDTPVTINVTTNDTDVDGTINATTVDLNPSLAGIQASYTDSNGNNWTVNSSGVVTFNPALLYYGTASITYNVKDNSGALSNAATITVTVGAVNHPPVVSDITKSGTEDNAVTFTASDFTSKFTDVDGNSLTKIKVVTLPANGILKLSGVVITAGQEITAANLANITFVPDANWNGTTSFDWNGFDGTVYAAVTAKVNINVAAVNDPPVVSDISKTGIEDIPVTFTAPDFTSKFTDIEGNSLIRVKIVTLPANGTLKLSGVAITAGQEIPAASLANITFVPAANWNGTTSFNWNGFDGTDYAVVAAKVNISLSAVNDPPVVSNIFKSCLEGAPTVTFSASDFTGNFYDEEGSSLFKIMITSLPANGTLKLNGIVVTQNQEIGPADLNKLTFTPFANWNGITTFGWNGNDGSLYAASPANVNITVIPVNNAPTFVAGGNLVVCANSGAQTVNNFAISISAGPADESSQVVTFLVFNDNNSLFTVQPALSDTGILTYTPANGKSGTARVTVQLMDDGGTQNGGNDTSAALSFTITLTPLPDAPSSIGVQNFCGSATVANLTASAPIGANVRWYAAASGGNVLPGTNILVPNTTYYAESFNSTTGCISARKAVVASIIALPAAPTGIAIQNFCLNSTVKDLVATAPTGSIVKWYASDRGGTELPASTLLVTNTSYYAESVNMTTGCVSASRTVISAVQYPPPALPNADAVQYFCGSAMVANLVASASNGTTVRWFATATGGMALSDATLLTTNNTYYAESVSNLSGCISTSRTPVLVTIYQIPDVPAAVSAQSFCGSANVSNLAATAPNGSILRWYATATGGTPLAATTALVSNTTYYVESVNSTTGCVSARITVLVTLLELPAAPTGSTIQNFCGSPTVKDLTAYAPTGSIVKWYAAVKGGTELPASTPLVFDTPYFAESVNTTTGCASATRTVIVAAVYPPPAPPLADAVQNFCGSATLANIKATVPTSLDMKWYTVPTGGAAIPLTTALTTGTYYAEAINNVTGCISSTRTAVKVNLNAYPVAPAAPASQVFCGGATVANLSVTPAAGTTVYWYTAATGGTALDNSSTLTTGTRYYAEAVNSTTGCVSLTRTAVTATVNVLPGAPTGNASQTFCTENAPKVSSLTVTGSNVVWYNAASGGTVVDATTALVNGTTYYAGQTVNGCTSSARLAVSAVVQTCNTPPVNKPPVVSDISKMINMNQTLAFTQNDFTGAYTDADKDVMVNIRIESLPLHGVLTLNGLNISAGQIILSSDLSKLVFKPDQDYYGNTSFRWTATDGKDYALASATVFITINKLDLFIPQGFSPNGDGIDDYFVIKGAERYIVTLRIFNRWGNKVYESDHYKNDWDGVSNVGILISKQLPSGTYYYTANFNNGDKEIIGYLTINR